jgi:hypothetical protein
MADCKALSVSNAVALMGGGGHRGVIEDGFAIGADNSADGCRPVAAAPGPAGQSPWSIQRIGRLLHFAGATKILSLKIRMAAARGAGGHRTFLRCIEERGRIFAVF